MDTKMGEATRWRVRAGRMSLAGKGCAEVAREVGVAPQPAGQSNRAGFRVELRILKRVGLLIKRMFCVSYSAVHVWRILRAPGFGNQKPQRRAIEQDETVVETFKRGTWRALK